MGDKIRKLREEFGLTQDELASHLEITRQTLSQIEQELRLLKVDELKKITEYFSVDLEFFLWDSKESCKKKYKYNKRKFEQLLLYILQSCGAKPNVGETVLYKLLYFSDFGFYEENNRFLTGQSYIKMAFGPAPCNFYPIIEKLIEKQKVQRIITKYKGYIQKKYIPLVEPDLSSFSQIELKFINSVIEEYSGYNAKAISDISHKQIPWRIADYGDVLRYEDTNLAKLRA